MGEFKSWFFSKELKLTLTLRYKIEILERELYGRGRLFENYVTELYKIRQSYSKDDPRNYISKLLLNSLYGKFGMNPNMVEWKLCKKWEDMPNEHYAHPLMSWDKVTDSRFPEWKLAEEGKLEDLLFFDSKNLILSTSINNTRTAFSQYKSF